MREIRLESHCHTKYSHDSWMQIEEIVSRCKELLIDAIVICDHDTYGLTCDEEKMFADAGIKLYRAIEFTTCEGIHIIGIDKDIKSLERSMGYYKINTLVNELSEIGAAIIIPHPCHETGVIGNGKLSEYEMDAILDRADLIEKENFRYGISEKILLKKYRDRLKLYGSDAHSVRYVGAFTNELTTEEFGEDILSAICRGGYVRKVENKSTKYYRCIRRYKTSAVYQFMLNLFTPKQRQSVKNALHSLMHH